MAYPGFYSGEDVTINGVPLNRVDGSGCKWVLEDIDGWWGLPEPNVPDDTRAFSQDGSFYAPGRYEARQLTLKGRIVPPGGVDGPRATAVARNALNQALSLVRTTGVLAVTDGSVLSYNGSDDDADGTIELTQSTAEVTQIANVQLIGRPLTRFDALNNVLEFNFQLRAADPRKYSSILSERSTPLLADASGRSYDRTFSYTYGTETGTDGLMTVINNGSYDTFGVLRLKGPVVNPTVEHIELGRTLSLNFTIGTDEYVDINLRDRTVYFNSTASRRGALKPSSSWFWIVPGVNTLRYTGTQTIPARPEYPAMSNLATNPSFEKGYGTALGLTNLVTMPRPISSTTGYTYTAGSGETGSFVAAGQDPSPAGILIRTNYARNPVSTPTAALFATYSTGTSESGSSTVVEAADPESDFDGPLPEIRSYSRRTVTAPKLSGSTGWQARSSSFNVPVTGVVGDKYSTSIFVRYTAPDGVLEGEPMWTTPMTLRMIYQVSSGTDTQSINSDTVNLVSGEWTRIHVTGVSTTNFVAIGWWLYQLGSEILPAGSMLDISGVLVERNTTTDDTVRPYFDGGIGETIGSIDQVYQHAWTGTANASSSTETMTVIPLATGPTGLLGYARRMVNAPGAAGSRALTYLSSASGPASGTTGDILSISGYFRSSRDIDVLFTGAAISGGGITVGSTTTAVTTLVSGEWTRFSVNVTATGAYNRVQAGITFSQALQYFDTIDISSIMIMKVTSSQLGEWPYFDGSYSPPTLQGVVGWTGADNNSTSTLTIAGVKTLGPTSSAVTGAGGVLILQSSLWSVDGEYSMMLDPRASTNNSTLAYPAGNSGAAALSRMGMVAGSTYTLSAFLYVPEVQQGTLHASARKMTLDVVRPSGTTSDFASSEQPDNAPGVYRLNFTVTLPADTTGVVLKLYNGSQITPVYWDGLMIEPGNDMSDTYVDGDSPWASWSGSADDSTSSRPYVEGIPESVVQLSYRSAWIE